MFLFFQKGLPKNKTRIVFALAFRLLNAAGRRSRSSFALVSRGIVTASHRSFGAVKPVSHDLVLFFSVFSALLVFLPSVAHAAVLYFDVPERVVVGETFEVAVMLDTEGVSVNALEGIVVISGEAASVESVRDGGSIVPLWVTQPSIEDGRATFSGIIPGGFTGVAEVFETDLAPGRVITLVLEAERAGTVTLSFDSASALLNTETPSPAPLTTTPATLSISIVEGVGVEGAEIGGASAVQENGQPTDTVPPAPFEPIIFEDPEYFGGVPVLLFNTVDGDSGVAYYELYSSRREMSENEDAAWTRITSPHALSKKDLDNFLYIKAVDHAGNERIAVISPQKLSPYAIFIIILLVLFTLSPLLFFYFQAHPRHLGNMKPNQ